MKDSFESDISRATAPGVIRLHRHITDATVGRRLEDYWTSMRNGGDVPLRSQVDPRAIEGILANTFLLEQIAPGHARFRVAGLHLSELMNMDVRGMPLTAFIAPEARGGLIAPLTTLFERPARLRLGLLSKAGGGRPEMTGRMTVLPLRDDLGGITRAIGCLVTHGAIGRTPRRFIVTECRIAPVRRERTAAPPPVRPAPEPSPGQRPYLRLVKSD